MIATPIEELAPRTEEEVREHLRSGKLVEGPQHMSPQYLQGIRRILTVSADTEFVSAPAYLRAAQHAPALNNFGSAMSIVQDELAHAHIGYRLLGDLGVDMDRLIYERPAREFRNSFQYAAIVGAKGALMFNALRPLLGEDRFFKALRLYHDINQLKVADAEDLREEFFAAVEVHQRRVVARMLTRWLTERHGDEDIAPPDPQLAAALGLTLEPTGAPNRNAFSRLGRFFWRQMTRIR